ncbi:hypothetical protein BMJ34_20890 [Sinorhizobium medicae]|nr:hypothetical protein BMJ34_20890 [Sinorhizobium medicae]
MATLSFSAAVAQWADKVEGAVEAIFKEATQEVVEEMQKPVGQGGRMRVSRWMRCFRARRVRVSGSRATRAHQYRRFPAADAGSNTRWITSARSFAGTVLRSSDGNTLF